jgi:phosphoribosylformylglycinamidine cyclo-ligase
MILVVAPERADALAAILAEAGEDVRRLGHVAPGQGVTYQGAL